MSEKNVLPCISPLLLIQENDDNLYLVAEVRPVKIGKMPINHEKIR